MASLAGNTQSVARPLVGLALTVAALSASGQAQLQPPPVPPENPITEAKRVLGKILFWDEQLSSDNTVACGTCHIPSSGGGADPRIGVHPGFDAQFETIDDVFGSPGVARMDANLDYINDPVFGFEPQATPRTAPSNTMAAYGPLQLWDGRAGPQFINPETGMLSVDGVIGPPGTPTGSLEAQSVRPLLNDVEMGNSGRTWADVRAKLEAVTPLAYASQIPPDMAAAVAANATYPALFQAAFGDPAITAERIGLALATHQRTLVPNQTPWDRTAGGQPNGLTIPQLLGFNTFASVGRCTQCHAPPAFTNQTFRNIGVRPPDEDLGRQLVTGAPLDRGRFKVPSIRNVGLKSRFMHNGRLSSLTDVVNFYRNVGNVQFADNRDPLIAEINIGPAQMADLLDFLQNGLTDARVAAEQFPFDRPKLFSELVVGDVNCDGFVTVGDIAGFVLALTAPGDYLTQFPDCNIFTADANHDGVVTVGDIGAFVGLLGG